MNIRATSASLTRIGAALAGVMISAVTLAAPNAAQAAPTDQGSSVAAVTIRNVHSGLCLDGSVSQGVRLNTCNGSPYQQWLISGGTHIIRHVQSGLWLDGSTAQGVRLNSYNNSVYQQWYLTNGPTRITRPAPTYLCLDGSISQGVRLNQCNTGTYQLWVW